MVWAPVGGAVKVYRQKYKHAAPASGSRTGTHSLALRARNPTQIYFTALPNGAALNEYPALLTVRGASFPKL
jgi:hypothetical protein